jgi:hypothetical protein
VPESLWPPTAGRPAQCCTDHRAAIVRGEEYNRGMKLLNSKYWPVKQVLDLSVILFHVINGWRSRFRLDEVSETPNQDF